MSNKVRRMLVLLLILLKEAGPTAACSSICSWSLYCYSSCTHCVCSSRGLSSVPQDLPTNIIVLNLYNNTITTLSQSDFSRYRSLTGLDLSYNQISMIHNKTFHNLTSLFQLFLSNNRLTTLPTGIFVGLGDLWSLTLHTNQLTSLPAVMFVGLGNLRHLHLNNNQLTSLPADIFEGLGYLWELYLNNNQLTSLPAGIFEGLGNLERLYLQSNNIHSIEAGTFNDTTQLRELDLQYNNISTITADTLGNLLQLRALRLSHNNISTFPVEAFSNLNISALSFLTLDNNQLETLPLMAYDILTSISYVNIDNNPWEQPYVNINNNPWQCDCRMAPFKQRMSGSYPFEDQIRCAGPANLTGQYLRDVNPEDLICEEMTPVYSSTIHILDSTLSLSPVSSSSPFHQSEMSSKAPTQSNTLTADSTPGWSTVSTGSPFGFQSTMTESNTGPTDGGIVLSVPLLATLGVILGLSIICTIGFAVGCMYKRRQRDPTPQQGFSNTNSTGTSSGHDQIGMQAFASNAEIKGQSDTPHPDTEDSQHIYTLPKDDDPDTAEYNTIGEVSQSESPHRGAGNRQSLDSFGYLNLTPPTLPPKNQTGPQAAAQIESADAAARTLISPSKTSQPGPGQIQHLGSFNNGIDEVPSPSLYPGEGPQSHKYVNSHMAAAAKDAAAGPQDVVYEYENEIVYENESVNNQSQTAAAPGADSPHHYEPLRNPSSQQQHTYTSLMPHGLQGN